MVKAEGLEVKVLYGKFFALTESETGDKLNVSLIAKMPGKAKTSNGNGGNGNGNGNGNYQYKLADGRTFDRLVDAIEALTGKPWILA